MSASEPRQHAADVKPLSAPVTPSLRPVRHSSRFAVLVEGFAVDSNGSRSSSNHSSPNLHPITIEWPEPSLPLIPQPLPTSWLLYVLTTSEGRDKMFKLLQYLLKLCISLLVTKHLFPVGTERFTEYWTQRLQRNISTIRKGRNMFKLGRWIVTLMHISVCIKRLRSYSRYAEERRIAKQSAAASNLDMATLPPSAAAAAAHSEPPLSELTAEAAFPENCRRSRHDFPLMGMTLLTVRNIASVLRNATRDLLFLSQSELLGFSAASNTIFGLGGYLKVNNYSRVQSFANRMWFFVSCCDLFFNTVRLLDRGWIEDAMTPETQMFCSCNFEELGKHGRVIYSMPKKKADMFFPPLDMDFGSVTPTTTKFFEAAPPKSMRPCCAVCGHLLTLRDEDDWPEEGVMFLPRYLRRAYGLLWCITNHENFQQTLLLQLRYSADVFLSYKFAFGDYERILQSGQLNGHNRIFLGSIAGLVSAAVALLRVAKAA